MGYGDVEHASIYCFTRLEIVHTFLSPDTRYEYTHDVYAQTNPRE